MLGQRMHLRSRPRQRSQLQSRNANSDYLLTLLIQIRTEPASREGLDRGHAAGRVALGSCVIQLTVGVGQNSMGLDNVRLIM